MEKRQRKCLAIINTKIQCISSQRKPYSHNVKRIFWEKFDVCCLEMAFFIEPSHTLHTKHFWNDFICFHPSNNGLNVFCYVHNSILVYRFHLIMRCGCVNKMRRVFSHYLKYNFIFSKHSLRLMFEDTHGKKNTFALLAIDFTIKAKCGSWQYDRSRKHLTDRFPLSFFVVVIQYCLFHRVGKLIAWKIIKIYGIR